MLVLALLSPMGVPLTYAALTEPETACTALKPKYIVLLKEWTDTKTKDQKAYQKAFEKAQIAHHSYVGCMFDFAEKSLLKSDAKEPSGTMDANSLNTGGIPIYSMLIDWMAPDQACLDETELTKIIKKSEPSQMLGPILQAHTDYRDHLNTIGNQFDGSSVMTDENGALLRSLDSLRAKAASEGTVKRQRKMEIESSRMAIDLMFTSLRELRLSLVMHVQFQCALKYLQGYRKALENLRKVIAPLPNKLQDASITR